MPESQTLNSRFWCASAFAADVPKVCYPKRLGHPTSTSAFIPPKPQASHLTVSGSAKNYIGLMKSYGIPIVSIVIPFWGYLLGWGSQILNKNWGKPKKQNYHGDYR